ncbi:MAG: STY4534 family ICE replication protein [Panacagrimonas sp.]
MTTSSEKSYFDLHITGLGYLNRIREVKPKKGDSFLACDIAALNGSSDNVSYVRFDARVSGTEAQHLVRRCNNAVEAKKKVMIGFRLGDLWTDIFTYTKGNNAGKPGVSLKVRLLFISWIKVDGQLVYKAEPKPTDDDARESDVPATTEAPAAQEASAPEPTQPAAEAANDTAADVPALAVAESF